MLNQRAPPPTYAYKDPSGQNLYITPVHQQRDEMVSHMHLNSTSGFIRMFNHWLSYFLSAWFLSPCLQIFLGCYSFHFVRFYSSIVLFIVLFIPHSEWSQSLKQIRNWLVSFQNLNIDDDTISFEVLYNYTLKHSVFIEFPPTFGLG